MDVHEVECHVDRLPVPVFQELFGVLDARIQIRADVVLHLLDDLELAGVEVGEGLTIDGRLVPFDLLLVDVLRRSDELEGLQVLSVEDRLDDLADLGVRGFGVVHVDPNVRVSVCFAAAILRSGGKKKKELLHQLIEHYNEHTFDGGPLDHN